jgi:hypothetical protein
MAVLVSTSMPHTGSLAFGITVHFFLSLLGYVVAMLINISAKDISFSMFHHEKPASQPAKQKETKKQNRKATLTA